MVQAAGIGIDGLGSFYITVLGIAGGSLVGFSFGSLLLLFGIHPFNRMTIGFN